MNKQIPEWITKNIAEPTPEWPAWLVSARQKEWDAFMQHGIPTKKNERWKYSDFSVLQQKAFVNAKRADVEDLQNVVNQHRLRRDDSILLVLVNGYFMPELSDMAKLPEHVIACGLHEACRQHSDLVATHWLRHEDAGHSFASLNAALCVDGLFLHLPEKTKLSAPLHMLSIVTQQDEFIAHPRHMFILGENSRLMLLEEHTSLAEQAYVMNITTSLHVASGAKVEHYKIQREGTRAIHLANTVIEQEQDSQVVLTQFAAGAQIARDDITVKLKASGAECRTAGFYGACVENQYIDHYIDIQHLAPRSSSEMLYKGVLDNKARAVFNGRLYVAKDAQKIVAHQANHNLLLSEQAEVYSKPELEIYADDVKCKHGATTGQLDQDALFYMCSRGISYEEATAILLQGFAQEIVQRITHPSILLRVLETM